MASIRKKIGSDGKTIRWEARIHRRGHGTLAKTWNSEREAEAWARSIEARYDRGASPIGTAGKATVSMAIDEFIAEHPDTTKTELVRFNRVKETIGDFRLATLRATNIKKWIKECGGLEVPRTPDTKLSRLYQADRNRTYASSTIRKWYFSLKKAIEWHAHENRYELDQHLFSGYSVPKAWGNESERRLNQGEEEKILFACRNASIKNRHRKVVGQEPREHGEFYACLVQFALETAARAQEMLLAEWSEFDTKGRTWVIPAEHVKTRKSRKVPLSKKALAVLATLKAMKSSKSDRVFHAIPLSSHKVTLKRILSDAGIIEVGFGYHVFRHECISRWVTTKPNLTLTQCMSISGHTDQRTFLRYANLRPSEIAPLLD